jgi:hypothetical protein
VRTVATPPKSKSRGVTLTGVGLTIQILDDKGNPLPAGVKVQESITVVDSSWYISAPVQTGTGVTDAKGMVGDRWLAYFYWTPGSVTIRQTITVNGYTATWTGTLTTAPSWTGDMSAPFKKPTP